MNPWKVLASRPLLDRSPWLTVREEDVRLPSGAEINGYIRSGTRDYVVVCAVLADGTVPMVRQYKHGAGKVLLDLPAGYLDTPEESPLEAAERELREETGVVAGEWRSLGHFLLDTNRGNNRAHFYLALGATPAGGQDLDETEEISVVFQRLSTLRDLVTSGQVESLASACGIMLALSDLS
jgi:ADP-ribose pyrophosphatase